MKAPQDIILKPMITEQSVDNMQQSKYTFKVAKDRQGWQEAENIHRIL